MQYLTNDLPSSFLEPTFNYDIPEEQLDIFDDSVKRSVEEYNVECNPESIHDTTLSQSNEFSDSFPELVINEKKINPKRQRLTPAQEKIILAFVHRIGRVLSSRVC